MITGKSVKITLIKRLVLGFFGEGEGEGGGDKSRSQFDVI